MKIGRLRASQETPINSPLNQINEVYSKKSSPIAYLNNSHIYFPSKLTAFVARNRRSLRLLNTTLYNRINNIVDPNANMVQSKLLINLLLGDCWRRGKLTLIFFGVTPKTSFKSLFFGALLEMLEHL
jgi:hypothetical protein